MVFHNGIYLGLLSLVSPACFCCFGTYEETRHSSCFVAGEGDERASVHPSARRSDDCNRLYIRMCPGFVVGKTPYSPCGHSVLHTDVKLVHHTVCVDVLPTSFCRNCVQGVRAQAGDELCCDQIYLGEVLATYMPPWCWHRIHPVFYCLWCDKWHNGCRFAHHRCARRLLRVSCSTGVSRSTCSGETCSR